jgi:hypothetical protein
MLPPSSLALSTLLVLISSPALVASSPSRLDTPTVHRVPIAKRGLSLFSKVRSAATSDGGDSIGVADLDNLNNALVVAQSKYLSGAAAYHQKTGNFLAGFDETSVSKWTQALLADVNDLTSLLTGGLLRKRQSSQLTNYLEDTLWAGTVSVGTPPQDFTIVRPFPLSFLLSLRSPRRASLTGLRHRFRRPLDPRYCCRRRLHLLRR